MSKLLFFLVFAASANTLIFAQNNGKKSFTYIPTTSISEKQKNIKSGQIGQIHF